jgi:regulatory protein
MKITGIEKANGTRYTIYVDNEYWYILDIEIIAANNLKVGSEIDLELLDNLKALSQSRKAKERALYLLGYRDHSSKELFDKLLKSVDKEIAEQTVKKMQELGFLDDEKYAQKLIQNYFEIKKLGARRVKYDIMKKGIDKETAENLTQQYLENSNNDEVLAELIERKYARYLGDERGKQKVINALTRLGHSYSDIKKALSQFGDDQYDY